MKSVSDIANDASLGTTFSNIYSVQIKPSKLFVPIGLENRLFGPHDASKEVEHCGQLTIEKDQEIITLRNKVTLEQTLFNPSRSKRPGLKDSKDMTALQQLCSRGDSCDFCNIENCTAICPWGRVREGSACSCSNIGKYDSAHGLILSDDHNPLSMTKQSLQDMFKCAEKWFVEAANYYPNSKYPHIMWDALPRASASQMHRHMQVSTSEYYYGQFALQHEAMERFEEKFGGNYWQDVAEIHVKLGLGRKIGSAYVFVTLTPAKECDVTVIGSHFGSEDFSAACHIGISGLVEKVGIESFSLAAFGPQVGSKKRFPSGEPVVVRMCDRGVLTDKRSDCGAMELYGAVYVKNDPFHIAQTLFS